MARKRSEHYVNNKEFLAAIVEYKEKVALAAERGEEKPRITRYIGECFLKIATHLSFKPNFVNYMFKDDMVCDGIENCVQYINNLIQRNLRIHLHTLHRSYIMHFFVEYKKKRNN